MKILMIGPVYPFSTGLSYYTGLLYNNLKGKHDVKMISYKMQYPKILFHREQIDYEDKAVVIEDVEYLINTANPLNWISVSKYINSLHVDLVIFQWLHPYFAPCFWFLSKSIKYGKCLFVCHNVLPHERFPFDKKLTAMALKQGDFFIVHSKEDKKQLKSIVHDANCKINVHPAYDFFRKKNISKRKGREELKLKADDNVLLFFGLIREYKGLKHLLNALPQIIEEIPNVKLLIAGEFCEDKDQYLQIIRKNHLEKYIKVYGRHLPTDEVEKFFVASDIVILPYESATQSGVIQVAYSFNKPVLATNVGGLPDVVEHMNTGYIVQPFSPQEIAKATIDFFLYARQKTFSTGIEKIKYKYSWDKMRKTIESFFSDEINQERD